MKRSVEYKYQFHASVWPEGIQPEATIKVFMLTEHCRFDKVRCVFTMVVVYKLSQAEFGRNGYGEDASHFISTNSVSIGSPPCSVINYILHSINITWAQA